MRKIILPSLALLTIFFFLSFPLLTAAQDTTSKCGKDNVETLGKPTGKGWYLLDGVDKECFECGDCDICDFLKMYIWASDWLVGIAGGVALLMIVYGGFLWLTSAGSQNLITKGKTIMVNTAIALVIILGGWMMVNTIINLVVGGSLGTTAEIKGITKYWSTPYACQTK